MVTNLVRNTRVRVAQFAAAHRWLYALAAIVFAALVGWEVHSLSTIDESISVQSPAQLVATPLADDERTVMVPHTFNPPSVLAGDLVDVAIWINPVMGASASRLIGPARVTSIDAQATSVVVRAADVIDIVEALSVGSVMVVPRAASG